VKEQQGVVRRVLVKDGEGGYADIVFLEDADAIERVVAAEQTSEVCGAFFSIMEGDDTHHVYEVIKTYQ
jgi:hypothetical protein